MRIPLILAAALLATPAMAQPTQQPQQPTLGQQLDSSVATVTRIVSEMSGQIAQDQANIATLQRLNAAAEAKITDRDKTIADLQAKAGPAEKSAPPKP